MPEPIVLSKEVKKHLKEVTIPLMEANLDKIDMSSWVSIITSKNADPEHPCGTTGCLAGYVCMSHGYSDKFLSKDLYNVDPTNPELPRGATKPQLFPEYNSVGELASALMGLSGFNQYECLFYDENWPEPFYSQYQELLDEESGNLPVANRKKAGKLVIKRLRHFIKTGF